MTAVALNWAFAEVAAAGTDFELRVPLCVRPDADWLREFEGLRVSRHLEARGSAWTAEPVDDRNVIRVLRVPPGAEAAIREALDEMVALAGARTEQVRAEEAALKRKQEQEVAQARQQAAEMTERFRSLAPAPAVRDDVPAEPVNGFHHRVRASREETSSGAASVPG
jgi:hypothetical protein